ncbi:MAG: hypothetical protein KIT83_17355 [Bryobacterales bacterium]|nr:hypothetical protein [Bryobacterales bacterium]
MHIADLLSRSGALPGAGGEFTSPESVRDRAASPALERARLHALLPTSGILLAPPEAEDKLDISPLAHAIMRAGDALDMESAYRVEALRAAYLRGDWEADDSLVASRLLPGLLSSATSEAQHSA